MTWTAKPARAWCKHILPHAHDAGWINDGSPITADIPLVKRELFGLIILAQIHNKDGERWRVGFDPDQHDQQNDGLVTDGKRFIRIEHKVVVEHHARDVLTEILATYEKYSAENKGASYGHDRTMIIHINKESEHGGMIRIYDVMHSISETWSFDQVLTLGQVSRKGDIGIWHVIQHFPKTNGGIAQIDFHYPTGKGNCPHCAIDL